MITPMRPVAERKLESESRAVAPVWSLRDTDDEETLLEKNQTNTLL